MTSPPAIEDNANPRMEAGGTKRPCPPDEVCEDEMYAPAPPARFFKGIGVMIPLGILLWAAILALLWVLFF
jgi:hypothetical protein